MNLLCLIFPISKSCIYQARSYLTLCCGNFILLLLLSAYSFILTWRTVLYPSIEKFLKDKNGIITDQENSESHLWCTEDRDLIHDQCYCPAQPYSLLWDKQTRAKGVWDTHLRGATPQCLEILKLTRTQTPSKTDKKKRRTTKHDIQIHKIYIIFHQQLITLEWVDLLLFFFFDWLGCSSEVAPNSLPRPLRQPKDWWSGHEGVCDWREKRMRVRAFTVKHL